MIDIDIEKMKEQLNSGGMLLPDFNTNEDIYLWMQQKRLERRKSRFSFDSKQATKLGDDMINHYVNVAQKGENDD